MSAWPFDHRDEAARPDDLLAAAGQFPRYPAVRSLRCAVSRYDLCE
jgi:hypothetical protein